jgi:hypothetical protein
MRYNDAVITDMDVKVKLLAGDHYDTIKAEFQDFHNDLRVATVREVMDLGVPRDVAENVIYYAQEVARGIDPNMRPKCDPVPGPLEPVEAE